MAAKVRMAAQAGLAAQVGVVWRRTLGIKRLYVRVVRLLGAGYRARAAAEGKRHALTPARGLDTIRQSGLSKRRARGYPVQFTVY